MSIINFPVLYVPDPEKGRPLFYGQIFVGETDLNPEIPANQKQLRIVQEDGTKVDVSQPFFLSAGGVPVYNGATVRLDVDGNYSLKILDKNGAQAYYIHNVFDGQPITAITLPDALISDISQEYAFKTISAMTGSGILFPEFKPLKVLNPLSFFEVTTGSGDFSLAGGLFATRTDISAARVEYENTQVSTSFGGFNLKDFNNLFQGLALDKNRFMSTMRGSIGHRGVAETFPENTLISLRNARGRYKFVEFDIRRTSDGVWVLMHDAAVDRTTNGTGNVDALTLAQIKALDAGTWKNATVFAGELVPTLKEALTECRNSDLFAYIEIKKFTIDSNDVQEILAIIESVAYFDKTLIFGQTSSANEIVRSENRFIELLYQFPSPSDIELDTATKGWPSGVLVQASNVDQTLIDRCRARGLPLDAYTVNEFEEVKRLEDLGVRRILTDSLITEGLK